ncbi:MAG: S26 family signal peptidase [Planctomycetia bacterium]
MTRTVSRWLAGGLGVAVGAMAVWLAMPVRYEVDGVSMAPGLVPGDVVRTGPLPGLDRFREPRRFERWVLVAGDGTPAIKRIAGLPGERVTIEAGDLVVDGRTVVKGPRILAEMGVPVAATSRAQAGWEEPPREVLDDAGVDGGRSAVLLPVRDVGLAAVVAVVGPVARVGARVRAVVGRTAITVRLAAPGRYAVVAGRLDGAVVAAAWPLGGRVDRGRSCLPSGPPEHWDVVAEWPGESGSDERSPRLAVTVAAVADGATAVIERVDCWRDGLLRPSADGLGQWQLGPAAVFVLGDHPAASRDSRQWGPVPVTALRHRLAAPAPSGR